MSSLKSSFNTFWNFPEHITHWKDFQILIYKTLKFFSLEKVHFLRFFQNTRIWFATKSASVDQVLTKIFQIDPKLTFNVFHILNHDHISKIEKYIWWYRPPPKKAFFFGGGSGGLKYKDLGYVSGRKEKLIKSSNEVLFHSLLLSKNPFPKENVTLNNRFFFAKKIEMVKTCQFSNLRYF